MVLTTSEARAYYDRFGKKQDAQGFYEDPALDDLIAHARFPEARRVFELGCGTGKLAARLLAQHLPPAATYLGCDVSSTMIGLASERLAAYGARAVVTRTDGSRRLPLGDHSVDRVVSSYVLDLLSEEDVRQFFAEAHRVLVPGGNLCLAGLTQGVGVVSRTVSFLWTSIFRIRAAWVGGCRPMLLESYADAERWRVDHRRVVTPYGVPSEVLVVAALPPSAD